MVVPRDASVCGKIYICLTTCAGENMKIVRKFSLAPEDFYPNLIKVRRPNIYSSHWYVQCGVVCPVAVLNVLW